VGPGDGASVRLLRLVPVRRARSDGSVL